ncbi:MAG TPA: RagB/SusD family nutrient uptake outer membrane protein, partial [Xylanibacter oryzae]|nr:RagB/SusD family nutrient uptake outer membrane protein [Xylanibacter oryzae]
SRGGTFGSRKAMQFMLPTYYLSFDKNDARRDVNCTAYSIYFLNKGATDDTWVDVGTTFSCIMPGKFRLSWCTEPISADARNLDIPVLRYSDVLLMYAETENYLNNGPTAEGIAALKDVRNRAGIGNMNIPSSQSAFDDAIAQERKWEFANEFMLRTDLIRMGRLSKELNATKQDMKDLSDRKNNYANTPVYRLYKFHQDNQKYGDTFVAVDYVDITDANELKVVTAVPTKSSDFALYQTKLASVLATHGVTVLSGDKWYPVDMFEAYTSSFNQKGRKAVGFTNGYNTLQIGNIIYTKPTGSAENGGKYPNWIQASDGSDGLYYGYKENHCELLPFANKSAGHPMVDNPKLTQLPGY